MNPSQPAACRICLLLAPLLVSTGCAIERPIRYDLQTNYSVHDPQFARVMGSLLGPQLIEGNAVHTLLNGDEIFPAMLDAIRAARRTVTFETYVYWKGSIGDQFTAAFCERARAGVKVHVLIDAIGSDKIDRNYVKRMKKAGVEVHEYHAFHIYDPSTWPQIDHRTHRKVMVVDGRIGFTGGVGIADEWQGNGTSPGEWRDNHYRVEGPVVAQLQAAFLDNWMQSTGKVLDRDVYFPHLAPAGHDFAQVFRSSSTGGSENMQLMLLLSISAAAKNVRMETAYFVPDDLTINTLVAARKRGVPVQIIVPGRHIDTPFVRDASRAHWGKLLEAGVEIYEYPRTMFHCKQLIVDDLWVSIGSANVDNRSFRINDEANLNVMDARFAAGQVAVFETDKSRAHPVTYDEWLHRPVGEKLADGFWSLLGWEL